MSTRHAYAFKGGPLDGLPIPFAGKPPEYVYCSEPIVKTSSTGGSVSHELWYYCQEPSEVHFTYKFDGAGSYVLE